MHVFLAQLLSFKGSLEYQMPSILHLHHFQHGDTCVKKLGQDGLQHCYQHIPLIYAPFPKYNFFFPLHSGCHSPLHFYPAQPLYRSQINKCLSVWRRTVFMSPKSSFASLLSGPLRCPVHPKAEGLLWAIAYMPFLHGT